MNASEAGLFPGVVGSTGVVTFFVDVVSESVEGVWGIFGIGTGVLAEVSLVGVAGNFGAVTPFMFAADSFGNFGITGLATKVSDAVVVGAGSGSGSDAGLSS